MTSHDAYLNAAVDPELNPVFPRIDFRYLSEADMIAAGVEDVAACTDAMEEALALHARGDYRMAGHNGESHGAKVQFPVNPAHEGMPADGPDRRYVAMPAYLGGSFRTMGVKTYASNIDNREIGLPRSILMLTLNDATSGAPLAYMSANLLSAYRTGCTSGVGARRFAPKNAKVLGLLGPGVIAKATVAALIEARPTVETIKVLGRSQKGIDTFISWAEETYPGMNVIAVEELEEVVRDSDIVTFCTSIHVGDPETYPTVRREWVKPGAFFAMPAACNLDEGMFEPDVRKLVDNAGMYDAWAEETEPGKSHNYVSIVGCKFNDRIHNGLMAPEELRDMGEALNHPAPEDDEEKITVYSVGGMPIEDVAWGTVVYRNAVSKGIGTVLNLWDVPAMS
ncbi:tyramine oxidase subunit B [Rothia nasimurium]|uniref:tyramine oxidase subunit B n=1 Tax=Rothia nasimurium TaxID=85336 RepID=UPI002DD69D5B|nr:tyramine oxidase subunit B [Rothia nasimurium]